jgi:VanZ family protein
MSDPSPVSAVTRFLHLIGWFAVFVISVLSLVPGDLRPHLVASTKAEHVAAYLITAALLAFGSRKRTRIIVTALLLMFYAAALEVTQLFIPGRNASVIDFAASSLGVCCGTLFVVFFRRLRR